jgi:hypothetical protein
MTKEEFADEWQHEIDGWLLDAAMEGRRGAELSVWLRNMRGKIRAKLFAIHDELTDKPALTIAKGTK